MADQKLTLDDVMRLTATHPVTKEDVKDFLTEIIDYIGIGFHIDTPFNEYVSDSDSSIRLFSDEMAELLDDHMECCMEVKVWGEDEDEDDDIYGMAIEIFISKWPDFFE